MDSESDIERSSSEEEQDEEQVSADDEESYEYKLGPLKGRWPFGGKGKDDDVPEPIGNACIRISKIIARAANKAGEYTFGGVADTLPAVPGLFIDGIGQIPVPLTEENAREVDYRLQSISLWPQL
ncbi:unnamed protein product [Phytophthora lilii]|uniref:Unnamed protein product n=1 Tax=Phytophthora lilii TaxID=2077276 RepID=A0A9W6TJV8_9STRA|nr:unnamed protein product [Phytophthora lilii]